MCKTKKKTFINVTLAIHLYIRAYYYIPTFIRKIDTNILVLKYKPVLGNL